MKKFSLAVAAALSAFAAQANAAPVQWSGNGHYYEFIATGVTFDEALAAAAASSHLGQQGYLATVTSQDEQDFIYANVTTSGTWFAGSDRETEGTWKWIAGPEAGTVFWQLGVGTLTYANWSTNEPNNFGNENFLYGNWSGPAWNDIGGGSLGYVIEYGGLQNAVPEPASWALMIGGFGLMGAAMRRRRTLAFA